MSSDTDRKVLDLIGADVSRSMPGEFGMMIDAVDGVQMLRNAELLEPPGSLTGMHREFLQGVTREALMVLDSDALLRDQRLYIDESE